MRESSAVKTRSVAIGLLVWLAVAAIAVRAGLLVRVLPPLILVGLAVLATTLALAVPALREWVRTADLRLFLLPHFIRFVGIVFLVLIARGELTPAFTPIGWGDLASAVGAVMLMLVGAPIARYSSRWWLWLAWSVFGAADMAYLVRTGIRFASIAPEEFTLFRQLPFGLLPAFVVPLIIATHVLILRRLFASPAV